MPNNVDGLQGEEYIANIAMVFANKFETLYNNVPYDRDHMDGLLNVINISIDNICECNKCNHVSHIININDVSNAVK